MTTRTRIAALAACALLFVAVHAASSEKAAATPQESGTQAGTESDSLGMSVDRMTDEWAGKGADLEKIAHSPADGSPYLGPKDAAVVVNVFIDFQCPVCTRVADPIKQLVLDFPDKVKVVYRNNALSSHSRAEATARAAMAAARQGKFWPYFDRLFAEFRARDDASLRRIATDLGLDGERFDKDLADPKIAELVRRESDAAVRLGVPGTPGLFVNGFRQMGWGSYRDLHNSVKREIAAADAASNSGKRPGEIAQARIRATADQNPKREGEAAVNADDWVKVLLAD